MKDSKFLIIRKDRKCDYCDTVIFKGNKMNFFEDRFKRCDDNDNQIGIEYFKNWMCLSCHNELCGPNPNSYEAQGYPPY